MRLPRYAVAAVLAAGIVVPAVSGAAVALAAPSSHSVGAFKDAPSSNNHDKKEKKNKRAKVFAANGKVTAVDAEAGTVTLAAKAGTKDVRRKTITVSVPAGVRIEVDGRRSTVAGVVAGARIAVTGTRVGADYTAVRISATSPKPGPSKSPVVTPSPSVTPSPTVTPSPGVTPSPTGTPDPTADPSEDPEDDL